MLGWAELMWQRKAPLKPKSGLSGAPALATLLLLASLAAAQSPVPPSADPGALERHSSDSLDLLRQQQQLEQFRNQTSLPLITGGTPLAPAPSGGAHFILKRVETTA